MEKERDRKRKAQEKLDFKEFLKKKQEEEEKKDGDQDQDGKD